MWGIVGMLVSTFVLIRDLFVYLIPGAVLFGAMLVTGVPQDIVAANAAKVAFVPKPEWLKIVVLVAVCYVLGHALVALGYTVLIDRFKRPTDVPSEPIYYRYRYPSLYFEAERRRIMSEFRFGLCISLVLSTIVMIWAGADWRLPVAAVVIVVIMFRSTVTAWAHVAKYDAATLSAGKTAKTDGILPEPRGAPKAKEGSDAPSGGG